MRISDWSSDVCSSDLKKTLIATATIGNSLRNAEVVEAMGLAGRIIGRWQRQNAEALHLAEEANARLAAISSFSRTFLLYVKVVIVTVSVLLVLPEELSPGARSSEARRVGKEWCCPVRSRWS